MTIREGAGLRPRNLVFWLLFAVVAACSAGADIERVPVPTGVATPDPTEEETSEFVARPSPTVVVERAGLDRSLFGTVVDAGSGQEMIDRQGNIIVVHGAALIPTVGDGASFGDTPNGTPKGASTGMRTVMVDLGWCAVGGVSDGPEGTAEFAIAADAGDEVVPATLAVDAIPSITPPFRFPDPGTCARGWLGLTGPGLHDAEVVAAYQRSGLVVRYVLTTRAGSALDHDLYQWTIDADSLGDVVDAQDRFGPGETVTFHDGELDGTTVRVSGWTEFLPGDGDTDDGSRPVGVLVEVCPASDAWPTLGLAIEGFNIVAPMSNERLEASVGKPSESCRLGWVEFEIPLGAQPTGFFASDLTTDAMAGFASWSLEGAALAAPE